MRTNKQIIHNIYKLIDNSKGKIDVYGTQLFCYKSLYHKWDKSIWYDWSSPEILLQRPFDERYKYFWYWYAFARMPGHVTHKFYIYNLYPHVNTCIDIKRYFWSLISHGLFRSIYITFIFLTSFRRQDLYKADVSNQCQIHFNENVDLYTVFIFHYD